MLQMLQILEMLQMLQFIILYVAYDTRCNICILVFETKNRKFICKRV